MYRPVLPHILQPIDGEKRSLLLGWALSGRACSAGMPDTKELALTVKKVKSGVVLYYAPPKKKTRKKPGR